MNTAFDRRSQTCLDWPELLTCLASHARSERGRAACLALPLAQSATEARDWVVDVAELAALLRAGLSLPALDFPDVDAIVEAAQHGDILGADELRPVATFCEVAAAWVRFFAAGADGADVSATPAARAPAVAARVQGLEPFSALAAQIRATFDAAGDIRDSVSPELARLRRERESLSARVRSTADELMRGEEFAGVLQDQFVTLRGDRYVLPLRASAKSLGLGIVHDTSRTGETVFVEPTALVVMNNRLKLAELEIQREIRRILEQLARQVAEAGPALHADGDILTGLDVVAAKARLGVAYDGAAPTLVDEPRVLLTRARHPLLVIRGLEQNFPVIANDVVLRDDGAKVLIISGPNAGGKTVLLKTVGLAALLARAGMLVPADAGGVVGFFDDVLADVGDRQSVMGDLSTFSAHLQNLVETLKRASADVDPPRRLLVLLDELMAGTNPEQGAALARATAERLAAAPGLTIITTHYDSLKGLAEGDGRFCNAGMEYDPEHLRPTFRLKQGMPGRSYALDIAARMGLPDDLLARARALAGDASVGLEEVIANLEAREAALREETEQLTATRQSLAQSEADQRRAEEALVRRERELAKHSRAAIEASVREAREELKAIVRGAQQAGTARAAEEARVTLAQAAEIALKNFPVEQAPAAPTAPALIIGARVHVPAMDAAGIVVKPPDARGRVKVTVGTITLDVDAASLTISAAPAKQAARGSAAARPSSSRTPSSVVAAADLDALALTFPTTATTLDLRGERVEEAVGRMEAFLDRAALDGRSPVFVIHGHGTGALRKAIREHLARSQYVRRFQPGGKGQGGDGVTVIDL